MRAVYIQGEMKRCGWTAQSVTSKLSHVETELLSVQGTLSAREQALAKKGKQPSHFKLTATALRNSG